MSTVTALVFVGNSHPNDGGIRPSLLIQLEEGDRPSFSFYSLKHPTKEPSGLPIGLNEFTVIPSLEYMLDDLILSIAYAYLEIPLIVKSLNEHKSIFTQMRYDAYELSEGQRLVLYEMLKHDESLPKISICLFKESELLKTVDHLQEYSMECEICISNFVRYYSSWANTPGWITEGAPKKLL